MRPEGACQRSNFFAVSTRVGRGCCSWCNSHQVGRYGLEGALRLFELRQPQTPEPRERPSLASSNMTTVSRERPGRTVLAASRWRWHVSPSSRRNVSHRTSMATVPTPTEQADGPRRTVMPRVRGGSEAQMMTVRQELAARELHDGGGFPRKSRGCSVSRRCTQHWNRQWKPILVEFPLLSSFRRIRTGCEGRAPSNDPPKHMWLLLEQADPELHVSDAPVVEADDNCSAAADLEGAVHAQIELSVLS